MRERDIAKIQLSEMRFLINYDGARLLHKEQDEQVRNTLSISELQGTEETRHTSCHHVRKTDDKNTENKTFWEELIMYFPLI